MNSQANSRKRCYVAIWYINVDKMPPENALQHIDKIKEVMTKEGYSNPFEELEEKLEANVIGYFVPRKTGLTELVIKEL